MNKLQVGDTGLGGRILYVANTGLYDLSHADRVSLCLAIEFVSL
jgi:hypothetical protein